MSSVNDYIEKELARWGAILLSDSANQQLEVFCVDLSGCTYALKKKRDFFPERIVALPEIKAGEVRFSIDREHFSNRIERKTSPQILHRAGALRVQGQSDLVLSLCILLDL